MPAATGKAAAAKGKGCAPPAADAPSIGHKTVKLLSLAALLLSDFAVLMAVLSVVAYVAAGAPFSYIAGVLAVCVVAYAAVCAYCAFSANRRFVRLFSTMVKQGEVDKVALHEVEDALAGKRVDWGGGARSSSRRAAPAAAPVDEPIDEDEVAPTTPRPSGAATRSFVAPRALLRPNGGGVTDPRRVVWLLCDAKGAAAAYHRAARQLSRRSVRSAHVTPFYRLMAFGWQPYISHCDFELTSGRATPPHSPFPSPSSDDRYINHSDFAGIFNANALFALIVGMPQLVAGLLFIVTVPPSTEGCAGDLLDPPAPCTLAEDFRKPNVARCEETRLGHGAPHTHHLPTAPHTHTVSSSRTSRASSLHRNIVLSSLGFVVVAVALTVLNWRCDFPAQVFALADAEERALLKTLKAEEAARYASPSSLRSYAPPRHSPPHISHPPSS